jgi:hypothetical protein
MLLTEREWDTLYDDAQGRAEGIVGFKLLDDKDGGAQVTCTTMHDVFVFFAAAGAVLNQADAAELARNAHATVVFDGGSPNGFVRLTLTDLQVADSLTGTPRTTTPAPTVEELLDLIYGRATTPRRRPVARDLDQSDVDADGERAAGDE